MISCQNPLLSESVTLNPFFYDHSQWGQAMENPTHELRGLPALTYVDPSLSPHCVSILVETLTYTNPAEGVVTVGFNWLSECLRVLSVFQFYTSYTSFFNAGELRHAMRLVGHILTFFCRTSLTDLWQWLGQTMASLERTWWAFVLNRRRIVRIALCADVRRSQLRVPSVCDDCPICAFTGFQRSQRFRPGTWLGHVPWMDRPMDYCWFIAFLTTWPEQLDFEVRLRQVHSDLTAHVLLGWHHVEHFATWLTKLFCFYFVANAFCWDSFHANDFLLTTVPPLFMFYSWLSFDPRHILVCELSSWQNSELTLFYTPFTQPVEGFWASLRILLLGAVVVQPNWLYCQTYSMSFVNLGLSLMCSRRKMMPPRASFSSILWSVTTALPLQQLTLTTSLGSMITWRPSLESVLYHHRIRTLCGGLSILQWILVKPRKVLGSLVFLLAHSGHSGLDRERRNNQIQTCAGDFSSCSVLSRSSSVCLDRTSFKQRQDGGSFSHPINVHACFVCLAECSRDIDTCFWPFGCCQTRRCNA